MKSKELLEKEILEEFKKFCIATLLLILLYLITFAYYITEEN